MANELYIYAKPADTIVELILDSGAQVRAGTSNANGRDDAHQLVLPSGITGQGGVLTVSSAGRTSQRVRGIVAPSDTGGPAAFMFDDFGELAVVPAPSPSPEPEPTPPPTDDPEGIIHHVWETGDFDLSTHDGCGQFTEACCTALHDHNNTLWGHLKKNPGQNQYHGHAVDAVQCLAGPQHGIWDIIHDSVSPNATPAYNYKGPADPALWYYPA